MNSVAERVRALPRRERLIIGTTGALMLAVSVLWVVATREASAAERYHEINLEISGMHCEVWCPVRVDAVLNGLPGIYELFVDVKTGRVKIQFDADHVSPHQIVARFSRSEYRVQDQSPVSVVNRSGGHEWRATLNAVHYGVHDHGTVVVSGPQTDSQVSARAGDGLRLTAEIANRIEGGSEFPFTIVEDVSTVSWIEVDVSDEHGRHPLRIPVNIVHHSAAQ